MQSIWRKGYDITLNRVPMGLKMFFSFPRRRRREARIRYWHDLGLTENFKTAKENDYLYGPFTADLPNFKEYINQDDPETKADFSYPINGYEAPMAKHSLFYTEHKVGGVPEEYRGALEFAKHIRKRLPIRHFPTLPVPPLSVMQSMILWGLSSSRLLRRRQESGRRTLKPAMEYLKRLAPYWNEGKTYPESAPTMMNMYSGGELIMGMSYPHTL